MKMIDYICAPMDVEAFTKIAAENAGVKIPESYLSSDSMSKIAKEVRTIRNAPFSILPFCHTVEGEAMGAIINLGDEISGPRVKEYKITDIKEILNIPSINYNEGRIKEVLMAIKMLKEQGETVLLEINGPITLLNNLIDIKYVFKALRRDKDTMGKVFQKLSSELMRYVEEAVNNGVDIISYADSAAGLSIVGPKVMTDIMDMFTVKFLKDLENKYSDKILIHLCPKTSYALVGDNRADFINIDLNNTEDKSYGEIIRESIGKYFFLGDRCLNHFDKNIKLNMVKAIKLR